ncbi:MAG: PKD domain-containing protein [Candidatus Lokiarchaeota archaeon]|nr:PKD domain-containing protein [Candidatus Lokiarchaeota archaeon]
MTRKTRVGSVLQLVACMLACVVSFAALGEHTSATTATWIYHYDDENAEYNILTWYSSASDCQALKTNYTFGSPVLVRGARFNYISMGSGPHAMTLQFSADAAFTQSSFSLPYTSTTLTSTTRPSGTEFIIDDDPELIINCTSPYANRMGITGDTVTTFVGSYKKAGTNPWTAISSPQFELIASILYEPINTITISTPVTGSFTSIDNADLYSISLGASTRYRFTLDRTSGTGNSNARLLVRGSSTKASNNLATTSGSAFPKTFEYTTTGANSFYVMVESDQFTEISDYSLTVTPVPIAAFTVSPSTITEGESVACTFTGSTGVTPTTYQWNFGDGTANSTLQNPTHVYTTAGTYDITLTVRDNNGAISKLTKTGAVTVYPPGAPIASFTVNTTWVISGRSVRATFTGIAGSPPTDYQWRFEWGILNETGPEPTSYVYLDTPPGTYSITLTVTDSLGFSSTCTMLNVVTVYAYDGDEDGDNLSNTMEIDYKTDPFDPDTDGDGYSDFDEIYRLFSDPLNPFDPLAPPANDPADISWILIAGVAGGGIAAALLAVVAVRKHQAMKTRKTGKAPPGRKNLDPGSTTATTTTSVPGTTRQERTSITTGTTTAGTTSAETQVTLRIPAPSPGKATVYCSTCNSLRNLSIPASGMAATCVTCGNLLARVLSCPHCKTHLFVDARFMQLHGGSKIACARCQQQFLLRLE